MTTAKSTLLPIIVTPGVQPSTDKTALATQHYAFSDKVRFRFGYPQKIGGWYSVALSYGATISGKARSLFSAILSTSVNTLVGTNSKLYSISGSQLTNITPLSATTVSIPGSTSSDYSTLASNPIATVSGGHTVTITTPNAPNCVPGDTITVSGASAFNGLSTGVLNTSHVIHTVGAGTVTTIVGTAATGSGSGGGASVVLASGRLRVLATAHGMANGQRVKITGSGDIAGISASTYINAEFVIRNVAANTFDFVTGGTANASVGGGGGASMAYQAEIPPGAADESQGKGYGMGNYGVGLYGTALLSSGQLIYPRVWFIDRFGTSLVLTAGNQTGLYTWDGSNNAAPALVNNAPTAINYAFVSNNIVVTFGAGAVNRIFASDQGNMTQWTGSSSNQVFDYTVVGAGQLRSHVPVNGGNLIFTDYQTYLFTYIGLPGVWGITQLENNVGIIGPMARCSVGGIAYWMGQNNFYMWAGGNVAIVPANTQAQSTLLNYVFGSINKGQAYKSFAWYNEQFDEVWFHYPSAGSNECDRVARLNRSDMTWAPDTFDRTCAEYPNLTNGYPRLVGGSGVLYAHEQGNDADGSPMPWTLTTNLRGGDLVKNNYRMLTTPNSVLTGFVPDSAQTGDINVRITSRRFPQSQFSMYQEDYTVTPTTEEVAVTVGGRLWQYTLYGSALGQSWTAGQWHEYVQQGAGQ